MMAVGGICGRRRGKREEPSERVSTNQSDSACVGRMSGLARDGTAEPVSRDHIIIRREWRQGKNIFPCSTDHEQDSFATIPG